MRLSPKRLLAIIALTFMGMIVTAMLARSYRDYADSRPCTGCMEDLMLRPFDRTHGVPLPAYVERYGMNGVERFFRPAGFVIDFILHLPMGYVLAILLGQAFAAGRRRGGKLAVLGLTRKQALWFTFLVTAAGAGLVFIRIGLYRPHVPLFPSLGATALPEPPCGPEPCGPPPDALPPEPVLE